MAEFFAMGGHGIYIWVSYGLAACVVTGLWLHTRLALRQSEYQQNNLQMTEPAKTHPFKPETSR